MLQRWQCHGHLLGKSPGRAQEESIAVILPGTSLPCGTIVGEIEIQFIGAHCQHQPCHQLAKQIKWLDRNLRTGCRVDNEDKLQG